MATRGSGRGAQLRERIAKEAARVMVEGGIRDFQLGKRKALESLRMSAAKHLPGNDEIEQAILEYQRLFRADTQPEHLTMLRRTALDVMRSLPDFKPRLVGSVLNGTADEHSTLTLHVFADPAETVSIHLLDRGIVHRHAEQRLRWSADEVGRLPAYHFFADDVAVELVVFSGPARGRVPLSPVDGRPMRRAALEEVQALVREAKVAGGPQPPEQKLGSQRSR